MLKSNQWQHNLITIGRIAVILVLLALAYFGEWDAVITFIVTFFVVEALSRK